MKCHPTQKRPFLRHAMHPELHSFPDTAQVFVIIMFYIHMCYARSSIHVLRCCALRVVTLCWRVVRMLLLCRRSTSRRIASWRSTRSTSGSPITSPSSGATRPRGRYSRASSSFSSHRYCFLSSCTELFFLHYVAVVYMHFNISSPLLLVHDTCSDTSV